ncbi:MAG: S1C family serine protease [Candidatus Hodarchaeales archaeon]
MSKQRTKRKKGKKKDIGVLTGLLVCFTAVVIFFAGTLSTSSDEGTSLPGLVRKVQDSVVVISVGGEYYGWSGSGVIISNNGLVLTAGHVLRYADVNDITVHFRDGTTAKVLSTYVEDERVADIGLLKIDLSTLTGPEGGTPIALQPCTFGTANVGEEVFAIGEPFGLVWSVTSGIVSGLGRQESFFGSVKLLQTDCPLNPGNSGCPVFNMNGEVIGICIGGIGGADGIGFCVPSSTCNLVISKYLIIEMLHRS